MIEEHAVRGGETVAARDGVSGDQTIERIPCERKVRSTRDDVANPAVIKTEPSVLGEAPFMTPLPTVTQ